MGVKINRDLKNGKIDSLNDDEIKMLKNVCCSDNNSMPFSDFKIQFNLSKIDFSNMKTGAYMNLDETHFSIRELTYHNIDFSDLNMEQDTSDKGKLLLIYSLKMAL